MDNMELVKAGDFLMSILFNIFLLRAIEMSEKHIQEKNVTEGFL